MRTTELNVAAGICLLIAGALSGIAIGIYIGKQPVDEVEVSSDPFAPPKVDPEEIDLVTFITSWQACMKWADAKDAATIASCNDYAYLVGRSLTR